MTLALLLTAVTGAWAQSTVTWTEADLTGSGSDLTTYTKDGVTIKCGDRLSGGKSFNGPVTISTTLGNFTKIEITGQGSAPIQSDIFTNDGNTATWTGNASSLNFPNAIAYATQFVFTIEPAEAPITVTWNASTKTGMFEMPGSDVVLTPIYAKAATFATTGTGTEATTLLPEAAEGVIAGTDASLIAEGTGIVAFAGTSTEVTQGTLMYTIGTSATEAPALTAFSATAPTAKNVADDGATVYVWYYIKGADAPTNVAATLDNTFDDTEPACLTVTVLTNKFDITFKAANANTIEAGKATVKVGDEAAEVDAKGNLTGVKMNSKVTVTAKEGYKFRKVEVKKAAPATTVTWNSSDFYFDPNPYTKDGVTLTPSNEMAANGNNLTFYGDNTFTTTLGKFIKIEIVFETTTYTFDGWTKETAGKYQPMPDVEPDWWEDLYKLTWTGDAESVTIKGKDVLGIHSITFTIQ